MAKATGSGEYEHHIVGVRARIVGSGNMDYSLQDYSNIQTQNLVPLPMQAATRFEPTVLSNFQSQRTRLIGTITELDEWFEISKIVIWVKPVVVEYPQ